MEKVKEFQILTKKYITTIFENETIPEQYQLDELNFLKIKYNAVMSVLTLFFPYTDKRMTLEDEANIRELLES